jgi:hypothetical protein
MIPNVNLLVNLPRKSDFSPMTNRRVDTMESLTGVMRIRPFKPGTDVIKVFGADILEQSQYAILTICQKVNMPFSQFDIFSP